MNSYGDSINTLKMNNMKTKFYGSVVILAGTMVFAANIGRVDFSIWKETAVFIVMYFLSQLLPTRLPQGDIFSITIFIDMVLIVLFGTPFAVTIGLLVTIITRLVSNIFGNRESIFKILKFSAQSALVIGTAGFMYDLLNKQVFAYIVSFLVYFLVSIFFLYATSRLESGKSSKLGKLSGIRMLFVNYAVLAIMAYTMTMVYKTSSSNWKLISILLFFVPILLVSHSFRLYTNIRQSYLKTVRTIAAAIEANDLYTKGHSERVSEMVLAMGKELGFPERELQSLEYVALLHDVGKIGIPETILNKPGSLSEEEYEEIKQHSAIGAEILQKIQFLSTKSNIILHHHEKMDGSGYPMGLKGESIPLGARILAIVDAYDAMTTDRPYRRARTPQEAVDELINCSGVHFDPELVKVFVRVIRKMGEI